jgi:hypothetical protein
MCGIVGIAGRWKVAHQLVKASSDWSIGLTIRVDWRP